MIRAARAGYLALVLAFVLSLPANATARPLWIVDFVYLGEGHDLSEHDDFAGNAAEIAGRHGIRRMITLDRIPGFAHPGPIAPDRIDLWSVPGRAALDAWQNDPDRVWFEDLAGHIMASQSSRYLASELAIATIRPGRLYLLDIARFLPATETAAFQAYIAALARAGRPHGLQDAATLGDVVHLSGPFGPIDGLRLFHVPSRPALDALLADPDYRAVEAGRTGLFDMHGSTRQLYRAASRFEP